MSRLAARSSRRGGLAARSAAQQAQEQAGSRDRAGRGRLGGLRRHPDPGRGLNLFKALQRVFRASASPAQGAGRAFASLVIASDPRVEEPGGWRSRGRGMPLDRRVALRAPRDDGRIARQAHAVVGLEGRGNSGRGFSLSRDLRRIFRASASPAQEAGRAFASFVIVSDPRVEEPGGWRSRGRGMPLDRRVALRAPRDDGRTARQAHAVVGLEGRCSSGRGFNLSRDLRRIFRASASPAQGAGRAFASLVIASGPRVEEPGGGDPGVAGCLWIAASPCGRLAMTGASPGKHTRSSASRADAIPGADSTFQGLAASFPGDRRARGRAERLPSPATRARRHRAVRAWTLRGARRAGRPADGLARLAEAPAWPAQRRRDIRTSGRPLDRAW